MKYENVCQRSPLSTLELGITWSTVTAFRVARRSSPVKPCGWPVAFLRGYLVEVMPGWHAYLILLHLSAMLKCMVKDAQYDITYD